MDKTSAKDWAEYLLKVQELYKEKDLEFDWDNICIVTRTSTSDEPLVILDYENRPLVVFDKDDSYRNTPLGNPDGWQAILDHKEELSGRLNA